MPVGGIIPGRGTIGIAGNGNGIGTAGLSIGGGIPRIPLKTNLHIFAHVARQTKFIYNMDFAKQTQNFTPHNARRLIHHHSPGRAWVKHPLLSKRFCGGVDKSLGLFLHPQLIIHPYVLLVLPTTVVSFPNGWRVVSEKRVTIITIIFRHFFTLQNCRSYITKIMTLTGM